MSTYFDKFLSYDNFYLALKRLQTTKYDLYKGLYIDDIKHFAYFEQANIELLIHNITEDKYEPSLACKILAPKKKNLIRPITVLSFIDLLVYQAITNIIADVFYDSFKVYQNNNIFGNVYRRSIDQDANFFYQKWQIQWKKYNTITQDNHKNGYEFFSDFDIASFFDTIDHGILINILETQDLDRRLIDLF